MLKRIFTGLYHFIWYVFAFIVLTAAVLVTVVRLALPEIGGYKNEIQSWVSEYMDYPVVIDEINAEWQGWAPHLYLKNIDLFTPDNSVLISKFDSAHLGIDLIASIKERELIPSQLSINGLNLEFTRNIDGSISINNDNAINTTSNNNASLSDWLLKQKHIVLENANLIWHDKKAYKIPQQFSNVRLDLKTQGQRIQVGAFIPLTEQHGQSLEVKMDMTGNILTPEWNGTVYIAANEINPTNLLNDLPIKAIGGNANIKLWTRWDKAKLVDINSDIRYSGFSLSTDQYDLPINNINLSLFGERKREKDWVINLSIEDLETSHGLWPTSNYQFNIERNDSENNYQYSGHFSYLKLEEILPFIVASNIVPEEVLKKIHWPSIQGELTNTNIGFNPESETEEIIWFNSQFEHISLFSNDKNNFITGLEGSIVANNKFTEIHIDSKYPEINLGSYFDKPYLLSAISADLKLENNESIEVIIKKLKLEDNYLSVNSSGKIIFDETSPFIDAVAHVAETNIEYLPNYLPKQTKPELRDWFTQALVGGNLLSGDLIFRGNTADYPFNNSEGNFKAILNVDNAIFDYADNWPPVDKLTAEIIIDNDDVYVSSTSGYIFDATIDGFTANIVNMTHDDSHILVNGSVDGHTNDAGHFISQSPLVENSSLSKLTENISGGINLELNIDIPLDTYETSVEGIITFSDTTLESDLPGLGLENVNGDVHFTTSELWANDIDALYHNTPVKFSIPKFDRYDSNAETYVISGQADKEFVISQINIFFPTLHDLNNSINKNLFGKSDWSLTLRKLINNKKTEHREIEFTSDLKGIDINLPFPLGKSKENINQLSIKTNFTDLIVNNISINYDNNFYADFIVDNTQDFIIKNILIGLGQQHPDELIQSDISIQGQLESLVVSDWIDFITPDNTSPNNDDSIKASKNITADINIQNLIMIGSEFNNVNINLSNPIDDFQIFFDSDQIKGKTNYSTINNNRLHGKFEKLVLNKQDDIEDEDENKIAIEKFPELDINVENFIYNNNELGQLTLLTNNIENGINISNLSIIKSGFSINASGEWLRIDDVDRSNFYALLEADSIETMLSTFNFNTANIKDGKTTIEMNANWMDTPMSFSMEDIEGELDMKIDKGSFLDINPSAGRLFGLLSLQTLPRRLTLDFTDLFEEGFAFDSIDGNFSIQQGHAYTNDLEMNGPSANIIVSGRTGLATEDYDQIATVTPKISSNLPVASALFGPIGVGVGAVIYLAGELFESIPKKIDKILSAQYTITGSWDSPNIEKIIDEEEKDSS
jgi:uncharacterized protein (TIGR02099 family)